MRTNWRTIATVLLLALLGNTPLFSRPLPKDIVARLSESGELERMVARLQDARSRGVDQPSGNLFRHRPSTLAGTTTDTLHVLVILVDFPDFTFDQGAPNFVAATPQMFDSLLFSRGRNPTHSMTEYYFENSYGKLFLVGDVTRWYRMPQTYGYYCNGQSGFGFYPRNAQKLVEDAIAAADPNVNFAQYDNDGDGRVEGIFVVHAGIGAEEAGGSGSLIWSHQWSINPRQVDSVFVSDYSMEPEETTGGRLIPIGVFCHEFGHVLGLPDLYDIDYSTNGIGDWSVMAGGSYNGGSRVPAQFDAWCKVTLGWVTPTNYVANADSQTLARVEDNPQVFRLWRGGAIGPQYFLVENRQRKLFDRFLPGDGLLIYHIDETVPGNWDENHRLVDIEQADGLRQLNNSGSQGDAADPFPGATNNRTFDDLSNPNSRDYGNQHTQVGVWNVSNSDSLMTANIEVFFSRPALAIASFWLDDTTFGNGDGVIDSAETVVLRLTVTSLMAAASGVSVVAQADNADILFSDRTSSLGTIASLDSVSNSADPIVFSLAPTLPLPRTVYFSLEVATADSLSVIQATVKGTLGRPRVLIVDDDSEKSYESYYTGALDSLREPYGFRTASLVSTADFASYPTAFWFTGDQRLPALAHQSVLKLQTFLDNGGQLFLSGQSLAEGLAAGPDSTFLTNYLHTRYAGNNPITSSLYTVGKPGDPITDSKKVWIMGADGAVNLTSPDYFSPLPQGPAILTYMSTGRAAGVRYGANYRVVFLGFGFEGITNTRTAQGYETREQFLSDVLNWLVTGRPTYLLGDVSDDGVVDLLDLVWLLQYELSGNPAPKPILQVGDVNCDTAYDMQDLVTLLNHVVFGDPLPCAP